MSEPRPLAAVAELARSTQGAREAGELLQRICTSVARTFGFDRTLITRVRADGAELGVLAAHGISAEEVRQLSASIDDWQVLKRALETRELVFVEDVRAERAVPEGVADEFAVRSALVLPLISQGRVIGFLSSDPGGDPFDLEGSEAELLRTIGALVASFLESALVQEELRRLDRLKSNFIALASHELRTPAAVIYGISSTLQLRGETLSDDQLHDLRLALYDQSDRLRQLVDQLLDLSRLEANAISIRPVPFRVRDRVEDLVTALVPEQVAAVELEIARELEAVTDPDAFDRIVSNLITNAFRYGAPPVKISAEQRDRHFRVAVEDRGRGVNPEFIPQMFERFSRSEESSTGISQGAGLGLSIAQSFAHAQGGDLLYSAAVPSGARFELVLPTRNS
jgi:signal transduction histidine kinase